MGWFSSARKCIGAGGHAFSNECLIVIIIYLQSECIERYQLELCSKYDRKYDFDVIVASWGRYVASIPVMSRDLLKHQVRRQFLSCHKFILSHHITFMSHWRLHHTMTTKRGDVAIDVFLVWLLVKSYDMLDHCFLYSTGIFGGHRKYSGILEKICEWPLS